MYLLLGSLNYGLQRLTNEKRFVDDWHLVNKVHRDNPKKINKQEGEVHLAFSLFVLLFFWLIIRWTFYQFVYCVVILIYFLFLETFVHQHIHSDNSIFSRLGLYKSLKKEHEYRHKFNDFNFSITHPIFDIFFHTYKGASSIK